MKEMYLIVQVFECNILPIIVEVVDDEMDAKTVCGILNRTARNSEYKVFKNI